MTPLVLRHFTATSCIGRGLQATLESLHAQRSGLTACAFETATLDTHIGEVPGVDEVQLPPALRRFDCRNNRLAQLGLAQDGFLDAVAVCADRWGRRRMGLFLGTSTSGMLETEIAYRRRDAATGALPADFDYAGSHNSYSLAAFVREIAGLDGPSAVVSSACSSSAKVFGSARRMIAAGLIDAAVVGGVDSLCLTTLYGFHSLQLVSRNPCKPFDVARDGISIGEAAAFALIERAPESPDDGAILLLGVGESSDAYHMSSPHPEGRGARAAMLQALGDAGLTAADINYINLHGTGTPSNDSAEGKAVASVFADRQRPVEASSTKGATGHTLGAAGALEAVICALSLRHGLLPGGANTLQVDASLEFEYLCANRQRPIARVLSNSFGFGGSNCALVLGRPC
ncbi:MAG TPA: beta-ketoacyl-[acyl-carrier-protein] synthase family protein [Steroidobacteraceae bacterium]|jgi:3-oxoacyl-[acyl-carrier-protein] synthase-1|nr:beta-ketoacyl-[acyl-carrier-protein] synthase family protein [Steroidobacteraceae bacterium]